MYDDTEQYNNSPYTCCVNGLSIIPEIFKLCYRQFKV